LDNKKERTIMSTEEKETNQAGPDATQESRNRAPDADIYAVIKRKGLDRGLWRKIGVAFRNRDGSANLRFDFYPRDPDTGIQIRWKEGDDDNN
jgi:hypothetical protein